MVGSDLPVAGRFKTVNSDRIWLVRKTSCNFSHERAAHNNETTERAANGTKCISNFQGRITAETWL